MSGPSATQVHELIHRLQTLEVELDDAALNRQLTEADYHARRSRLGEAIANATRLQKIASANVASNMIPSHVDLPVMGDQTRVEQRIVSRFVGDTRKYTVELAEKLDRVSDWTRAAASASHGWIRSIIRLSWIRQQIRRVDQDLDRVRKARKVVEDFIARTEMGGRDSQPSARQNDLLAAFREFEASAGRITAMKARLRGEMVRNAEMRAWLAQYADNRRQKDPEMMPPDPNAVQDISRRMAEPLAGGANVAKDRLVIARQLARALEDKFEDAPEAVARENEAPLPMKSPKKSKKYPKEVRR